MNEQLQPLTDFSDEQLWRLVYQPFALEQDARLSELTVLGKSGKLSDEEEREMEGLIGENDRYILLRTQALVMLKQRGHDVERRLKSGA